MKSDSVYREVATLNARLVMGREHARNLPLPSGRSRIAVDET